jgi:cell shape-determining protein MreC
MIYRQRNKNRHIGTKVIVTFFVVVVILRIFNINIISKIFDAPANYILESQTVVLSPFINTLIYFKSKKELEEQNKSLQSDNVNLKLENLLNNTISQEFEYFKNEFGTTTQGSLYKVILKPPFTPFDNIQIVGDLGSKQVGDLVFFKTILIGKIVEKSDRYATVELFSTPDKVTPVSIKGTQFEAKGLGGGRFVLEASKEFEVTEGEAIIYPEQTLVILGVVEFIELKEEDLFKKIYFNVPVPISSISYVTIGIQ